MIEVRDKQNTSNTLLNLCMPMIEERDKQNTSYTFLRVGVWNYKWKYHFYEMKEAVGMSSQEKKKETRRYL